MTYPTGPLPAKYFRRVRSLLLCSVWEQVVPLSHYHRKTYVIVISLRYALLSLFTHNFLLSFAQARFVLFLTFARPRTFRLFFHTLKTAQSNE